MSEFYFDMKGWEEKLAQIVLFFIGTLQRIKLLLNPWRICGRQYIYYVVV
jgi:hypothetical protein